jgi:hypothetical protein
MKWLGVFLLTVVSAVVLAQGWKTISSKEAGLQFSVPAEPKASSRTDADGGYSVPTRMWIATGGNTNYVVSVSFIPNNAPSSFSANMVKGIKKGFLDSTSGKIVADKPATYAGVSGQQMTFSTPTGVKGDVWIITRGKKVITFTIAKAAGSSYSAEKAKFFGSLKLK